LGQQSEIFRKKISNYEFWIQCEEENHKSYISSLKSFKDEVTKKILKKIKENSSKQQDSQISINSRTLTIQTDGDRISFINDEINKLNKEIENVSMLSILKESTCNEIQAKIEKAQKSLIVSF
jgi:hypothetical protein